MLKTFFSLEWKSFTRSASFKANLFLKIVMVLAVLYFVAIFTVLGVGLFYILKKQGLPPLETVNKFLIVLLVFDLVFRYFLQKMPVMNIRPLLSLNIRKNSIVGYSLGKTFFSMFNWVYIFFLLPFTIVLIKEDFGAVGALSWFIGVFSLIFVNNFLNILINNKAPLLYFLVGVVVSFALMAYYNILDLTQYTQPFFQSLYESPVFAFIPILLLFTLVFVTYKYFKKNLYLDAGLKVKQQDAQTENYTWLNKYGILGTFIKNDIKLIKRNKRSKTTILISVLFIFYGLLFFTGSIEAYEGPVWRIFAGIFVTGGFLFTFGQFVPSWDSSYYPLMMSQNIQYREYLNAKWWLMIIAVIVTTIISSFYLYFGWEVYLAIIVGAIYNMGVNAHLVLWGGAYIRTPIDLTQNKNVLGNKQAFNSKTLLLSLPKLVLPLILYAIGHYLFEPRAGYIIVAAVGILGFTFKNKVFGIIENIYKTQKYKTLAAYKQSN